MKENLFPSREGLGVGYPVRGVTPPEERSLTHPYTPPEEGNYRW